MTNKKFKEIRTNVYSLEKIFQPTSGRLVGIELNGISYSQRKYNGNLTRTQLEYFEYLNDFNRKEPYDLL